MQHDTHRRRQDCRRDRLADHPFRCRRCCMAIGWTKMNVNGATGAAGGRARKISPRVIEALAPRRISRASMSPCRTRKPPSRWRTRRRGRRRAAGAVNLLIFQRGPDRRPQHRLRWACANPCAKDWDDLRTGKTVVLLGAGGAARGAILALEVLGRGPDPYSQPPSATGGNAGEDRCQAHGGERDWTGRDLEDWPKVAGDADSAGQHHQRRHEGPIRRWSLICRCCPSIRRGLRYRLQSAGDRIAERCRGARPRRHRRPGHADASGGAVFRSFLRRQAQGHARAARDAGTGAPCAAAKPFVIGLTGSHRHGQKRNRQTVRRRRRAGV